MDLNADPIREVLCDCCFNVNASFECVALASDCGSAFIVVLFLGLCYQEVLQEA